MAARIYRPTVAEGNADINATSANHVAQGALDDIHECLGDGPFAVIGNSFGGMVAQYVAHERRDHVLGLATLAGVYEPTHQARILPRRQVVRADASVLALAGQARDDYEEMTVVQSEATLDAFTRYALPGLRGAKTKPFLNGWRRSMRSRSNPRSRTLLPSKRLRCTFSGVRIT
jgi:pimeloyl-ACP methyl ester carboxylesterase